MTWIHYLLIFWFVSVIVVVSVRVYNLRRRNDAKKTTLKQWLIVLVAAPFALLFVPIIPIGDYFDNLYKKWKEKKEEEEEIRFKATLGLGPDENYLCFSHMGGAGIIKCADCGYEEKITSFTHGSYSCTIGRQCPICLFMNIMRARNTTLLGKPRRILFVSIAELLSEKKKSPYSRVMMILYSAQSVTVQDCITTWCTSHRYFAKTLDI